MARCDHLDQIKIVTPNAEGCKECLVLGDSWVHLHLRMSCGDLGCCDISKNKHASKHFRETQHPIVMSYEPTEVRLSLERPGMLAVEVADDGRGPSPVRRAGIGLRSMRERAEELGGTLSFSARPHGGTPVRATLPFSQVQNGANEQGDR